MLPPSMRILLCTTPQDLRRSFDGLAGVVTQLLGQDPRSGTLYVFVNRRANRAKVLWFERNGQCLLYKRLHRARFRAPRTGAPGETAIQLDGRELAALLEGVAGVPRAKRVDAGSRA
jgi:transposase